MAFETYYPPTGSTRGWSYADPAMIPTLIPHKLWHDWLAEVTYKPGWKFSLGVQGAAGTMDMYGPMITVEVNVTDSVTLEPLILIHTAPLCCWPEASREDFLRAVFEVVRGIETHETMEFFQVKGERLYNPHPSTGDVLYAPSYESQPAATGA